MGIWVVVYAADYYLTITAARLYEHGAKAHVVYERSYELNPRFEADVNALRTFSPRFVVLLVFGSVLIAGLWYFADQVPEERGLFLFIYGVLVFPELTMVARHTSNITQFRRLRAHQGVDGEIRFARWLVLETSSVSLCAMSALFLVAAVVAWKATLFGGVAGLLSDALSQVRTSRRLRAKAELSVDPAPAS